MALADKEQKNKKRQLAKNQLPSSSTKRKPKPKAKTPAKTTVRKTVAKKPSTAKSARAKTIKKPVAKATVKSKKLTKIPKRATQSRKAKPQKTLSINLPFSRQTLQVSVKLAAKPKKPQKKPTRSAKTAKQKRQVPKKRQAAVSLLFILSGITGSSYFGLRVFAAPALQPTVTTESPEPAPLPETKGPKTLPASMATKLQIPTIGVDVAVASVGKNPDNTVEVPTDYHVPGLYKFGPTPGELGPAIIVGHVDNYKGPAVFWRLREVQPGHLINVGRADGSTAVFKVTKVNNFAQNAFPTKEIYGNIDYAGLRLITCGGSFNILTQRYSENTVVFARLVE